MKSFKILLILLGFSNVAFAGDDIRKISVTGKSKVSLEAQYSIIHTEMKFVKKRMDESYQELQNSLSKVIENLKKIGLSDKEIVKSIVRQGSEYTWKNNSKEHLGYFSACNMQLRVNDLDKLHSIYNELSKYDSLTIELTEYGRNDEFERRNEEFKKALLAAKEKAVLMAKSLNSEVGSVFRIQEISSQNIITTNLYENRAKIERSGSTFGSVDIIATVFVEFELK